MNLNYSLKKFGRLVIMDRKRFFSLLAGTLIALSVGLSGIAVSSVSADSNSDALSSQLNDNDDSTKFDKYVTVQGNKYVLNIPKDGSIPLTQLADVSDAITNANQAVQDNGLVINKLNKVASKTLDNTADIERYGRTGILLVRWNFVRIGLDKGLVNDVLHSGAAAGAAAGGYYGGWRGAAVGAAVGSVIDRHLDSKSGWWFDYNFFYRRITTFGRQ